MPADPFDDLTASHLPDRSARPTAVARRTRLSSPNHYLVRPGDRLTVTRLLAARGPIPGAEAAAALGWSDDRWWAVVGTASGLFDITGKGWVLTAAGRAFMASGGRPWGD